MMRVDRGWSDCQVVCTTSLTAICMQYANMQRFCCVAPSNGSFCSPSHMSPVACTKCCNIQYSSMFLLACEQHVIIRLCMTLSSGHVLRWCILLAQSLSLIHGGLCASCPPTDCCTCWCRLNLQVYKRWRHIDHLVKTVSLPESRTEGQ